LTLAAIEKQSFSRQWSYRCVRAIPDPAQGASGGWGPVRL